MFAMFVAHPENGDEDEPAVGGEHDEQSEAARARAARQHARRGPLRLVQQSLRAHVRPPAPALALSSARRVQARLLAALRPREPHQLQPRQPVRSASHERSPHLHSHGRRPGRQRAHEQGA